MTIETLDTAAAAPTARAIVAPAAPVGAARATLEIARRALLKFMRTPGLWAMGIVQSALFLFSFRYVFGGAVHAGRLAYVDYLVPGYVATIVLFTGGGIAVAVAEDRVQGFTDRLLSLPLPRSAIVLGRTLADSVTNTWAVVSTAAFGFLFGYRLGGSISDALAALGLCLVFAVVFTVVFIVIGLIAPNAQAAQGMSMIAFVLAFFSSTYVPVASMVGFIQPFAKYQPVTPMVNGVRALLVGSTTDVGLALAWSALVLVVFTPVAVARYRHA
ncbi:MAG TPA: ABC transporter permease [Acidimicrobiales bacterium]|nr:ABC transporter permease [Acidimicrobiales bacterium]